MEKMTSGCYGGVVNSWGCNWVGLVHNKEPPVKKTNRPKFTLQAVQTQHNYGKTIIECHKDRKIYSTDKARGEFLGCV